MAAKAKKVERWGEALPRRVAELQKTMERRARKRWDDATELLPPAPRRALKRLTANVDRARDDLRKRGDKMVADARRRAERFTTDLRHRMETAIEPITKRLDVASRTEVIRLQKRVNELERRVAAHRTHSTPA